MITRTNPTIMQIQRPVRVVELKSPLIASERKNEALNALLTIQDHVVRGGLGQ